jgi:hypothetical protein
MLSIDFQRLAWISDLDGKINNAGLRDYLADRTDEVTGRVDSSVGEAIAALREFGAVQSADVCSKALEQWERFASAMNDAARKGKAIEFRDIAESCHELDVRYWGAQKNMYERLRHYLRENASRFVPRK